jgi:hypothetical protein
VFPVDYILKAAEPEPEERYQMLLYGGVILIEIIWNCEYDWDYFVDYTCLPQYSFTRFDYRFRETKSSAGFNFR